MTQSSLMAATGAEWAVLRVTRSVVRQRHRASAHIARVMGTVSVLPDFPSNNQSIHAGRRKCVWASRSSSGTFQHLNPPIECRRHGWIVGGDIGRSRITPDRAIDWRRSSQVRVIGECNPAAEITRSVASDRVWCGRCGGWCGRMPDPTYGRMVTHGLENGRALEWSDDIRLPGGRDRRSMLRLAGGSLAAASRWIPAFAGMTFQQLAVVGV